MELMQASKQWATRPDDERFVSLLDLQATTNKVRDLSRGKVISTHAVEFIATSPTLDGDLYMASRDTGNKVMPNHWAFGQLCERAKAPTSYLRTLPAINAAELLTLGFMREEVEDMGILIGLDEVSGKPATLRAATGPNYGRVWNQVIIDALVNRFGDGVSGDWKVPGEFGKDVPITKQNTTIYGSDRDMFVFLADEKNRIEMPNRRDGKSGSLARGWFVWNSEVGSQSFGMSSFLFDYTCSNRIVWGAAEYKETRFRHTAGAPDKWQETVLPMIDSYAECSAKPWEAGIIAAQAKKIDNVNQFLMARFNQKQAHAILVAHEKDEGRPIETLWDAATGITAYARDIPHQDARILVEREAGRVLDLATA